MMIAAMYLRKSRAEEQSPVSETLARHREALTAHAAAGNITVAAVYEEVASGDSLHGRPEMLRLLADLSHYDAVLCMDIDRLGRGAMREQGLILEALRDANVCVVTPGKTYNLRDDTDDSLISFKALFAREEYKLIRGRLRRGVMKTIQDGGYVANAPYGYRRTRIHKKPTLLIDEREADAVRLMFDLYEKGNGCQSIADTLHSLGYTPHRGVKFNRTSVAKILRNSIYIGKIVWNQRSYKRPKHPGEKSSRTQNPESEWLVFEGVHDPIIGEDQFKRVNTLLSHRYHPPYRKPDEIKNPLSGVLFCANCGRSMTRQPQGNPPHSRPVILCQTAGCCMSSNLDVVEQAVYTALKVLLLELPTHAKESGIPSAGNDRMAQNAESEISRLKNQLNSLHDLLERQIYDADTFQTRREDIEARIKAAREIVRQSHEIKPAEIPAHPLRTILDAYWTGNALERNRLIRSAIGRMEYVKPKNSGWKAPPTIRFISWAKNI